MQGDALFFRLPSVAFSNGSKLSVTSAKDTGGNELVAYDAFMVLSDNGTKPAHSDDETQTFTHVGLPFYATLGHFLRVKLVLPDVLRRISVDNSYKAGTSERALLALLGSALASHLSSAPSGGVADGIILLHKARGVVAVFESTGAPDGKNLLDTVLAEASQFIDDHESRRSADLYEMASVGLLAQGWCAERVAQLGEAVIEEVTRRTLVPKIEGMSESERLRLAWTLLGPGDGEVTWLEKSCECDSQCPETPGFNVLTAASELETLDEVSPSAYAPRNANLLPWLLSAGPLASPQSEGPAVGQWCALRTLLSQWSALAEKESEAGGLWMLLDNLMLDGSAAPEKTLDKCVAMLSLGAPCATVQKALVNPICTLASVAEECLRNLPRPEGQLADIPPRLMLASLLRAVVMKRKAVAQKYPIRSADYPSSQGTSHPISRERMLEMWGTQALPIDKALYDQARRDVHQQQRALSDKELVVKEALSDKEYRRRGGRFAFPTHVDTFVPGLHRRTKDLHSHWKRKGKAGGSHAREAAVEELLLRLPWDDSDQQARAKLSKILACIWSGLEGLDRSGEPLSSALWLGDDEKNVVDGHMDMKTTGGASGSRINDDDGDGAGDGEWKCV